MSGMEQVQEEVHAEADFEHGDGIMSEEAQVQEIINGFPASPEVNGSNVSNGSRPGARRYSRAELMELRELPVSNVKPADFDPLIDKDNGLLALRKSDKEDHVEEERRPRRRDRGRRYDEEQDWGGPWRRYERDSRQRDSRWAAGEWTAQEESWQEEPQWDMPDSAAGLEGSLQDCTLGDIRKYGAPQTHGDFGTIPEVQNLFTFNEGVREEDRAKSVGWCKWFGNSKGAEAKAEADLPLPVVTAPAPVAPAPAPKLAAPGRSDKTRLEGEDLVQRSSKQSPSAQPARPGVVGNSVRGYGDKKVVETHVKSRQHASARPAYPSSEQAAPVNHTGSNSAGRSILSMLGRQNAPEPQQGKLSVADLFQIAKGQQLPPIPAMSSAHAGAPGGGKDDEARKVARALWEAAHVGNERPERPTPSYPVPSREWHDPYAQAMNLGRATAGYQAPTPSYATRCGTDERERAREVGERSATLTAQAKASLGVYSAAQGLTRDTPAQNFPAGLDGSANGQEEDAGCSQS
ncbi:unnamed protein product [Effrenium voratum]|uniref:Uncharacterized protein n=1 Tax=Effrenium voratum TaxID=2562239 RepID=A0AA36J5B1_9DINO|nr:unnamed protein product [Effrenium voratum]